MASCVIVLQLNSPSSHGRLPKLGLPGGHLVSAGNFVECTKTTRFISARVMCQYVSLRINLLQATARLVVCFCRQVLS